MAAQEQQLEGRKAALDEDHKRLVGECWGYVPHCRFLWDCCGMFMSYVAALPLLHSRSTGSVHILVLQLDGQENSAVAVFCL